MGLTMSLHLICGRTWSKDQLFSISQVGTYINIDSNEILLNAIFSFVQMSFVQNNNLKSSDIDTLKFYSTYFNVFEE